MTIAMITTAITCLNVTTAETVIDKTRISVAQMTVGNFSTYLMPLTLDGVLYFDMLPWLPNVQMQVSILAWRFESWHVVSLLNMWTERLFEKQRKTHFCF